MIQHNQVLAQWETLVKEYMVDLDCKIEIVLGNNLSSLKSFL